MYYSALAIDSQSLFQINCRLIWFIQALYGGDWRNQEAQSRSWSIHHSGDLALILSNPPSFYATGPAHRLFVDGRLNHVFNLRFDDME